MAVRTGGAWVVEALRAEGVRHVFGVPGVHNLAIYDALLGQSEVVHVLARHEAGAAFMADGYARSSGRPGVALVTTGPGATNTLTPLVESYAGSIPVVVLMSDVASTLVGREVGALHEVPDQIACFRPVCRWAHAVGDAKEVPGIVGEALARLATGRPGPAAISIPNDFLTARIEGEAPAPTTRTRAVADAGGIGEAARRLAAARRPVLIAGGGVVAAGAGDELLRLARRLRAPVITTVMGRGAISERDPLWQGVLPNRRATEPVIRQADVVLAAGCRFAHRSTQGLLLNLSFSAEQTLIHLDLDPRVIGRLFPAQLGLVGDARDGLARILARLGDAAPAAGWDLASLGPLRSAASERYTPAVADFIAALRAAVPDDGIVVNDQTGVNYWMEWFFPVVAPRTFLYPVGSAVLGYGVPAAIGAQLANPGRPVVAVVGDGGFLFSVNELATAVKYRLPIAFVVMNDDRFGAIKWLQERMFGRWGEADLANPDFPALARAFGARGERVPATAVLGEALARAWRADGPSVLECALDVEPPWDV